MTRKLLWKALMGLCVLSGVYSNGEDDLSVGAERYRIEGRVVRPDSSLVSPAEWFASTKVFTNGGHYGFLREDGSFVINNVPSGSYVVQVMNPTYIYEPLRVDINSKGKIRARAVNHIQPSNVVQMPHPLRMKSVGPYRYFLQREQWRLTDTLMNPMVLMTVLPLALMMILPRLNDPETRKEMEQIQMPKMDTPELSEIMTSLFGGGSTNTQCQGNQPKARSRPNKRKDKS
ncbi:endoplasmic reticulum membrane protein complex subunit 7 [Procambarus clarkii]|uniref:endoplasmic reticulum membrane protein complex subunit 7 n=1 Tax=Procambarus clarkii TaxID=6728 RepID=UPI001E6742F4|nr:ER membrane protein complex subunit 7-like isoform X2 [Procambarus clarkii]